MANSVDPDQTALIGAVCSRSKLFASMLNSSIVLGNNMLQTTSAEDIFRCIFFSWHFTGYLFACWEMLMVFLTDFQLSGIPSDCQTLYRV